MDDCLKTKRHIRWMQHVGWDGLDISSWSGVRYRAPYDADNTHWLTVSQKFALGGGSVCMSLLCNFIITTNNRITVITIVLKTVLMSVIVIYYSVKITPMTVTTKNIQIGELPKSPPS